MSFSDPESKNTNFRRYLSLYIFQKKKFLQPPARDLFSSPVAPETKLYIFWPNSVYKQYFASSWVLIMILFHRLNSVHQIWGRVQIEFNEGSMSRILQEKSATLDHVHEIPDWWMELPSIWLYQEEIWWWFCCYTIQLVSFKWYSMRLWWFWVHMPKGRYVE